MALIPIFYVYRKLENKDSSNPYLQVSKDQSLTFITQYTRATLLGTYFFCKNKTQKIVHTWIIFRTLKLGSWRLESSYAIWNWHPTPESIFIRKCWVWQSHGGKIPALYKVHGPSAIKRLLPRQPCQVTRSYLISSPKHPIPTLSLKIYPLDLHSWSFYF